MFDKKKHEEAAKAAKKENKKYLNILKKEKNGVVDTLFFEAHEKAFEKINCLTCANCCKTTGPLFTQKDIQRIANYLKLKPGKFIEKYLKIDDENDFVLQQTPCKFLHSDNYCSIYEVRPKACAEYPHTDRRNQKQLFNLTLKNCEICPAVLSVLENIKK